MIRIRKTRPAPWTMMPGAKVTVKKPRKFIRSISRRRALSMDRYVTLKEQFLARNPFCSVCIRFLLEYQKELKFPDGVSEVMAEGCRFSTEIHHMRGRAGSLLLDTNHWIAVSREGHMWIHEHPDEARKLGLLCPKGDWNKP